ncbi:MAG: hypothetical protein ACJA09_000306 [Alcanivorax sp.]|jgi:hypothetical protein
MSLDESKFLLFDVWEVQNIRDGKSFMILLAGQRITSVYSDDIRKAGSVPSVIRGAA